MQEETKVELGEVTKTKPNLGGFPAFIERSIQAFFFAHAIYLLVFPYDESELEVESLPGMNAIFLLALTLLILSIIITFDDRLNLSQRKGLTIISWFSFASMMVITTTMPSVIIALLLVTAAIILYQGVYSKFWLIPTGLFIAKIFYLWFSDGIVIPDIFEHMSRVPSISLVSVYAAIYTAVVALIVYLAIKFKLLKPNTLADSKFFFTIIIILLVFAVFTHVVWQGLALANRIINLRAPTYDMGIFTQMYHGILRTGQPLTTLERDRLLSHFHVHVSPIVYVLVPIFALFPHPEVLNVMQVVIVGSGLIPFLLIAKRLNFTKKYLIVLASVYLLQPALILSNFFDFHENVFLVPSILFLLYFMMKGSYSGIAIFSILTLMVKEDAFLYVFVLGIYLFLGAGKREVSEFNKKQARIVAIAMIVGSVVVFLLNVMYLRANGLGEMSNRFTNLEIYSELGLMSIVISAFETPVLFISTLFTPAKVSYLLIILASLGFLPLFNKKAYRLALWLPLLVMNLMSNYHYQHQINFHYNYGSASILLVFSILVLSEMLNLTVDESEPRVAYKTKFSTRRIVSSILLVLAISTASFHTIDYLTSRFPAPHLMLNQPEQIVETHEVLDAVPRDAVVVADTFFTVSMADIPELYDINYFDLRRDREMPDYIILKRSLFNNGSYSRVPEFIDMGYSENEDLSTNYVIVLTA